MRGFVLLLLTGMLVSCGTDRDVLTPIIGPVTSQFRGNSIGDKYQKVLEQVSQDHPTPSEEGVVTCEFNVEQAEMLVRYEFDQDRLYAMQADIFFPDSSDLHAFEQALIKRYDSNFGDVQIDGGFLVWKDNSSGTEVEFTLADESIEFGQPKLSLTIYNFDY